MGKIRSTIKKMDNSYYNKVEKQLLDYLGFGEGDEIEFEPRKVFQIKKEALSQINEVKIKLTDTCFNYGVSTLSTKDRPLFPEDKHPFILEIDNKDHIKHVASLKIAMKDFFDAHQELREKDYIRIKILEPFERYKLEY